MEDDDEHERKNIPKLLIEANTRPENSDRTQKIRSA